MEASSNTFFTVDLIFPDLSFSSSGSSSWGSIPEIGLKATILDWVSVVSSGDWVAIVGIWPNVLINSSTLAILFWFAAESSDSKINPSLDSWSVDWIPQFLNKPSDSSNTNVPNLLRDKIVYALATSKSRSKSKLLEDFFNL